MTIDNSIKKFLDYQIAKGNSKETLTYYKRNLELFNEYCVENKLLYTNNLNSDVFFDYQKSLIENFANLKKVSLQTYSRAVKVYMRWLYFNDTETDIDINKLKLLKSEKTQVVPLSDDELKVIFSVYSENDFFAVRNKLICALMCDCGLRRGEIVLLRKSDVNFINRTLFIRGKGSKERLVPFGDFVDELLKQYLSKMKYVDFVIVDTDCLFIMKDGTCLTKNALKQMFRKLKISSGIERLYAHLLRHTFATNYILDGGELDVLQIIMGHSSIKTTQRYVHLAAQQRIINSRRPTHLDSYYEKVAV